MNDWLSILIVILIIGIVLDGLRRARKNRRSELRLSPNARKIDRYFEQEEQSGLASEFPNGGARPKTASERAQLASEQARSESASSEATPVQPPGKPVQTSLDLDDPVPMLMDTVEQEETDQPTEDIELASVTEEEFEPSLGSLDELETIEDRPSEEPKPAAHKEENASIFQRARTAVEEKIQSQLHETPTKEKQPEEKPDEGPREILIVNVMARAGENISGAELRQAFAEQKLKFGEMGIFHRHFENDGDAAVIYSVANIVEPGSFDFAEMDTMETPGLSLFLALPAACPAIDAYDDLVYTARAIASAVGGELKDENRSTFTNQTVEHGRQKAMEFERKYKLNMSK